MLYHPHPDRGAEPRPSYSLCVPSPNRLPDSALAFSFSYSLSYKDLPAIFGGGFYAVLSPFKLTLPLGLYDINLVNSASDAVQQEGIILALLTSDGAILASFTESISGFQIFARNDVALGSIVFHVAAGSADYSTSVLVARQGQSAVVLPPHVLSSGVESLDPGPMPSQRSAVHLSPHAKDPSVTDRLLEVDAVARRLAAARAPRKHWPPRPPPGLTAPRAPPKRKPPARPLAYMWAPPPEYEYESEYEFPPPLAPNPPSPASPRENMLALEFHTPPDEFLSRPPPKAPRSPPPKPLPSRATTPSPNLPGPGVTLADTPRNDTARSDPPQIDAVRSEPPRIDAERADPPRASNPPSNSHPSHKPDPALVSGPELLDLTRRSPPQHDSGPAGNGRPSPTGITQIGSGTLTPTSGSASHAVPAGPVGLLASILMGLVCMTLVARAEV
jgi:hypothetical protein